MKYRINDTEDFFYYNEITSKVELILNNSFSGRKEFILDKEK